MIEILSIILGIAVLVALIAQYPSLKCKWKGGHKTDGDFYCVYCWADLSD